MLEGRLLNERYVVKRLIGGGGMANVYLGFDNILEREVAIKVLRLEYSNDDEFITRFHREAQSATSLSHENIVNIYDVGEEDDIYYMVMEYVEGLTLKEYIQRYGPITIEDSIEIMSQITSAIEHAHVNHIVHRDIKPQNILIDKNRTVKVTDFGIALALTATSLTQTNSVLGSVHYLSPEQARGGMANRKSDIYSLGIVFYEMLTGKIPFNGQSAVSIALKHLEAQMPSMREWDPLIPQSLENIVLKATTKDPFHRYQRVADIEKDLSTALNPDRINEPTYLPPNEPGDATKAISVITNDQMSQGLMNEADRLNQEMTRPGGAPVTNQEKQEPEKKKMSRKKKTVIWVITLLMLVIGSSLVALFILPNILQPDDVQLEDLREMHQDEAIDLLKEQGLDYVLEDSYSDEIDPDYVVTTDPAPNTTVKEGRTVTLFISQGPEPQPFPEYIGESFNQVERLLYQQGFINIRREDTYSDEPEGQIVGQQPREGISVVPHETEIVFEVSIGRKPVVLQNLEGMTVEAATRYLEDRDLIVNIIEENSDTIDEGIVISHSPEEGEQLEPSSIINVVVSMGVEELSPITHHLKEMVQYTEVVTMPEPEPEPEPDPEDDEAGEEEVEPDPEPLTPSGQQVRIYIGDMNNELTDLYEQETIYSDKEFSIRLVIPPNSTATYKIERDDQVVVQKTIAYDEVEGD